MKNSIKTYFVILVFISSISCSRNKNTMFNRNYHAITSKYNILYNGKQAYAEGLNEIQGNYKDDFWKRLTIEPMGISGSIFRNPSEAQLLASEKSKSFDRAEEKAVKAIQKHSMNIRGYEKNSQIDDAYLLLGKSRYYTKRYIPAIEAFNYIIANYPGANLNYQTRVWRAKSNVRLGNEELAIETMNLLVKVLDSKEEIPKSMVEEAYTAMAMAYAQTDTIHKLVHYLKKATQTSYNKEQTGRNLFVLGQVYNELNQKDSARAVFKKITNTRRIPRKYKLHANIELSKTMGDGNDSKDLLKKLKKATKNPLNKKYFNQLYFQLGNLSKTHNKYKEAIEYYQKSLRVDDDNLQKTHTYESLGDLYFDNSDYLLAGSYYDSVSKVVPEKSKFDKRIRRIKKKNEGLLLLRKYETILKKNDSILKLVDMTNSERVLFFENHIKILKKQDNIRKQQLLNSQNFGGLPSGSSTNNYSGKWYFYSVNSKQLGMTDFKRVWGNRTLADNWRWADNEFIDNSINKGNEVTNQTKKRYDLESYLNTVPNNLEVISLITEGRNESLYKLGIIYKEKFKNYDLALIKLERLKLININKDIDLPLEYHLYQIYHELGRKEKAIHSKENIITNYPNSNYASLLSGGTSNISNNIKHSTNAELKYKEVYVMYKEEQYSNVINRINLTTQSIGSSYLIPKFALLKALAIGKIQSKEDFENALHLVLVKYPDTIEGTKAKELLTKLKKI